ncbi:MAG TPA: PQQ-dependent sugar dehydrogenase, partial [Gemmatimonadaceae bacterium]
MRRWMLLITCLVVGACDNSNDPSQPGTGAIDVTVSGLPGGVQGAVTITGGGGFSRTLTASGKVNGLQPGSYTVAATDVTNAGTTYVANPASQAVTVTAGATSPVAVAYSAATADFSLRFETVATGLTSPVYVASPPGDPRLFVVEQNGRVRIVSNGTLLTQPFLDVRSRVNFNGERGLLSIAFHPSYATNGFFFIYFTDTDGNIRVERFHVSSNPDVADAASSTLIIGIAHPTFANHNGGLLMFGPDGMLYMGTGDGGSGGDPNGNGQNRNALLGKLLRLDVNGALPYVVPPNNPFVGQSGARGEIWAMGLRNPWRYAFDRQAGLLYIADVGQDNREEVDVVSAATGGQNYGWNIMEGTGCYGSQTCSQTGLTLPVIDYPHSEGCSITGGFVYRGTSIPEIAGQYFYSDYCSGWLRSFRIVNGTVTSPKQWDVPGLSSPTSFGEDSAGEL